MVLCRSALLAILAVLPASFAQISNDFESGWDQTAWPIYAPDCNQGGTVALDSTTAHSGENSIKVTSPGGYCGHIFFGTTAVPTSGDVYVRVWLKATNALTSNHVSFITMPDSAQAAGKHLRIGGQDQVLMYNRESDDATLPDMSPQGVATSQALPTGAWECFEYYLGTDGSIETWLNSAVIPGLTTLGGANATVQAGWTKSTIIPKITGVYFGWESYGGDANTFWYDDVAISSSRVGCSAAGGGSTTPSTSSTPVTSSSVSATSAPGTTLTTSVVSSSAPVSTPTAIVVTAPLYGQCGGQGWTGATVCASGSTCKASGTYYSQCLPSN